MVETDQLDSWMGGGMRMFGKIDKMLYRTSGASVMHNGKEYFINFRDIPALEDEDIGLRILPSEDRKIEALNKVKNMRWCYDRETDRIKLLDLSVSCDELISKESITEIQIFKVLYDGNEERIELQLLNNESND
ncbi:hypothetical protein GCM10022393_13730 [Aquimarina addita]|uniref:Uncharacterized protein n=1 Tax=Aquimarina addita TaxID=870485 RepID=A0ABP7XFU4_9FLAO